VLRFNYSKSTLSKKEQIMVSEKILRETMLWLIEDSISLYHASKSEHEAMRTWARQNELLADAYLEAYSTYIAGYASQVGHKGFIGKGTVGENDVALEALRNQYAPLQNPAIAGWFLEAHENFPLTRRYLMAVDYLRLFTIEYLELWKHKNRLL
jgi:hypothetical protein